MKRLVWKQIVKRFTVSMGTGILLTFFGSHTFAARANRLSEKVLMMEQGLEEEFEAYFDTELPDATQTPEDIAQTLAQLAEQTGQRTAVLWAMPRGDHLSLVLLTSDGEPIVKALDDVPNSKLQSAVRFFHLELHSSSRGNRDILPTLTF